MNSWTNPNDPRDTQNNSVAYTQTQYTYTVESPIPEPAAPQPIPVRRKSSAGWIIGAVAAVIVSFVLGMAAMGAALYFDFDPMALLSGPARPYDPSLGGPGNNDQGSSKPDLPQDSPDDAQPGETPSQDPNADTEPAPPTIAEQQSGVPDGASPHVVLHTAAGRSSMTVNAIAEKLLPSVVSVIAYESDSVDDGYSLGTGMIYTSDGYIITNFHVIETGVRVEIMLSDGTVYEAQHIASSADADIAILKIDAVGLTPVEFGKSSELKIGDPAIVIGNPASLELVGTTTVGYITGPERIITVDSAGNVMRLIQTDASVNPGNSGGPLINQYGQVVGVVTAKMTAELYEGIGFAIATDRLETIVADLLAYGYVTGYPMLGITGSTVYAGEVDGNNPMGVLVAEVSARSGAYNKIYVGDIIYTCNGQTIRSIPEINAIKARMSVGDTMTLTVYRNGEHIDVEIVLTDKYLID